MSESDGEEKKLNRKQYASAIVQIARITYSAAPLAIVLKIIGAIIASVLPIVTTYFAAQTTTALAEASAGDPTAGNRAILYVLITAALGISMTAWNSLNRYMQDMMTYKIEATVSDRMYEHFLSLDFWRYDDKKTIDLHDRAVDFGRLFPYTFDRITDVVTQLITMLTALVALVFVSWWLGAVLIAAVIPGVFIQFKLSRAQVNHMKAHYDTRRTRDMIEWKLMNPLKIAELRLYGLARHLLDMRQVLRDKDERGRIEFERTFIFKQLFADVVEASAEVVALLWIVMQIIARTQPIGQFLYVQQIVSRALGGAGGFASTLSGIDKDLANLFDYQEFMELPERDSSQNKEITTSPDCIELRDVSFHYPQSKTMVLQDVSLTIRAGQHIAIVGENGAGKSTLIKIITGLYQPVSGTIHVDGDDLKSVQITSWHRYLAVLQQSYLAYDFATVKDNIYYGDISVPLDQKRFDDAVRSAEAQTFLEKLPKGFDSYVSNWMEHEDGTKGVDLSGGQWQRLALARNFYRDSPIIILDEPTSAIDALAESRIFKHLFADKNRTVITISHRLTTVERADAIYMLHDGKVAEQGTHDELIKKRGAYFTMFESQLRGHEK